MNRYIPQGGYSEFCLLHRLGLFGGFRILNFNILGGLEKKWLFFVVLAISRYFLGSLSKLTIFLGLSKFTVFLGGPSV